MNSNETNSLVEQLAGLHLENEGMLISWDFETDEKPIQTNTANLVQKFETPCVGPSSLKIETAIIEPSKVKMDERQVVGRTEYGNFFLGEFDNFMVSIKCPLANVDNAKKWKEVEEDVKERMRLVHPNVAKCFGCLGPELKIVYEYMPCGSLDTWIASHKPSILLVFKLVREIAVAMEYLNAIINRPINLSSPIVYLDQNLNIKITDFGMWKLYGLEAQLPMPRNFAKHAVYLGPEHLTPKRIKERGVKGDAFGFGVIIWQLLTCKTPWNSLPFIEIVERIRKGDRLEIPDSCPENLKHIMNICWRDDPTERPSFSEICRLLPV